MRLALRRSDAMSIGLVAYGIGGVLLLVAVLALVLTALASVERTAASVDAASGAGLAERLAPLERSMDEAEAAIAGFDATLGSTAASARDGQRLSLRLAESLHRLSAALDVTVLGTRPFAGLGAEFVAVADEARALAADLDATAVSLDGNREALDRLAGEIAGFREDLAGLRAELGAGEPAEPGVGSGPGAQAGPAGLRAGEAVALTRIVVVALLAWLAIPALLAVGLGRRRWVAARAVLHERPGGGPAVHARHAAATPSEGRDAGAEHGRR